MTKEIIDELLTKVKFESWPKREPGGQSCGFLVAGVKLTCEETSFEVCVAYHRSLYKNKEIAQKLYVEYLNNLD